MQEMSRKFDNIFHKIHRNQRLYRYGLYLFYNKILVFFSVCVFYGLLYKYEKKQLFYVIAFFLSVKFYSWLLLEHCEPGYYLSNNTCLPCEIGTYKNTSSHDVTLDKMLRWNCSACEGIYTTISKNSTTCISKLDIIIDFCFQNLLHICRNQDKRWNLKSYLIN